ncbi:MAG: polysaccharide deacetylase family protein [Acidobacteriota bacterium]
MLLCCMYHRVEADKDSNSRLILEQHFRYISESFNVVLPGEALSDDVPNVCLVFDDASYSFYQYVFPLLRQTGIRVLLAVAPRFILEADGGIGSEKRLSVPTDQMMQSTTYANAVPFCTWAELRELCGSGLVRIASHSYSHKNLLFSRHLDDEIKKSEEVIEEKLLQPVDSFVYPYGQFNASVAEQVGAHYRYSFAVGAGDNVSWRGVGGILFRIAADDLPDPTSIFSRSNLMKYRLLRYRLYAKKWYYMNHRVPV